MNETALSKAGAEPPVDRDDPRRSSIEEQSELPFERVIDIARKIGTGMLVTETDDGLRSRPMSLAEVTDQGELWFLTSITSPKVEQLREHPGVAVVLAEANKYLSLTGRAELVRDPVKIRRLWAEPHRVWFKSEDDPDLVLLRIEPSFAEYWDQSGWKGIKYAARAVGAYVKGEQLRDSDPDLRSHAKVEMR
jgi:general stress protein 26